MSSSSRSRVFAWRICIEQSCDETYVADLDSICLLAYESMQDSKTFQNDLLASDSIR